MNIVKQSVELLASTPNPEQLIERCGRVAYKSEDKISTGTATAFIRKIIELGHESVLEHASATLLVVCDRGISHEIVRHRIGSYTQESTRFCNYSRSRFGKEITVVEPPGLPSDLRNHWHNSCVNAEIAYHALVEHGVGPQIARSVLPTCLKTEIAITYNFREWRHFLRLRLAPAAHPQMQSIAKVIHSILIALAPACFDVIEVKT